MRSLLALTMQVKKALFREIVQAVNASAVALSPIVAKIQSGSGPAPKKQGAELAGLRASRSIRGGYRLRPFPRTSNLSVSRALCRVEWRHVYCAPTKFVGGSQVFRRGRTVDR